MEKVCSNARFHNVRCRSLSECIYPHTQVSLFLFRYKCTGIPLNEEQGAEARKLKIKPIWITHKYDNYDELSIYTWCACVSYYLFKKAFYY
jgi:hypothetical protein